MPGGATERAFTANFTWYMFFSCVVAASGGAVSLPLCSWQEFSSLVQTKYDSQFIAEHLVPPAFRMISSTALESAPPMRSTLQAGF